MSGKSREKSAGERIIRGLTEFRDALRAGEKISERFTVRTVELKLEPRVFSDEDVQAVRTMLGLSQAIFARFLGVSVNTVRSWEQGVKPPSPMACRFLDEISRAPDYWKRRLAEVLVERAGSHS